MTRSSAAVGWLASLVQIAAGCYLIYLGVKTWLEAKPKRLEKRSDHTQEAAGHGFGWESFVNLSNPKVITFFLSLYAATMPAAPLWTKLAVLLGGFLFEIVWYGLVILLFSTPPARAAYDRAGHWIERAVGTALTVFGLKLTSEKLWSRATV
ncbi:MULTISPECIES: LysE family translocator [Rhizobium]|uniref:Threonine/homoserine/homoserine lactone efflux protein n=1 Tax=Rhizobium esperanzae TaxID=1967781 RepID=A0A7W6UIU9_9HYPH|nr:MULTISPECIES: LysE family transporter [Rhizobium]MBB4438184.1 threonine/homoserine/homoserine lactone efflux protein [Rhizobium esperanzae]MDH6201004.1 threonine/homoserine/homoserine lactone efflux protein [Rhizobium leguminosarum]